MRLKKNLQQEQSRGFGESKVNEELDNCHHLRKKKPENYPQLKVLNLSYSELLSLQNRTAYKKEEIKSQITINKA